MLENNRKTNKSFTNLRIQIGSKSPMQILTVAPTMMKTIGRFVSLELGKIIVEQHLWGDELERDWEQDLGFSKCGELFFVNFNNTETVKEVCFSSPPSGLYL